MKKRIKDLRVETYKLILVISIIFILIFAVLLIIGKNTKDYRDVVLKKNKNTIFSISDLTVNDFEYTESEKTIEKKLGKPNKEKEYEKYNFKYKKLYYKGLTLTLRENYDDYMLIGAEITNNKYKMNRNIKVGENILKVIKKFKVDNKEGTYLYGNYSVNALNAKEITSTIYLGVRGKKEVSYVYRDQVIEDQRTNIARLTISYKRGEVKKVTWIYDYE